jgi:hypothetical protein
VKFQWSRTRALLVGVALIVVTNAVVLAGVAYNRSSEPEAVLQLSERELGLRNWSWPANENSSIDLHLEWRVASDESWYRGLHWLQPAQLQELGFQISGNLKNDEEAQRLSRQPSRSAWLVLEHDGPSYQASLDRARKAVKKPERCAQINPGNEECEKELSAARERLDDEERTNSRLFVVDAGLDEDALRARYPDRQHYVLARGRLSVYVQGTPERLIAAVDEIDVNAIRVPFEYREIVEPFMEREGYYKKREPRFAATVNFGRRFEPWIVDLKLLN